jgi:hypothetical protein
MLIELHQSTNTVHFGGDKGIGLRRIMVHGYTTTLNSGDQNTCVTFVCTIEHHCIECSHNKALHSELLFLITCNPSDAHSHTRHFLMDGGLSQGS